MRIPNFLYEEFVDETIFNNAVATIQGAVVETGSGGTFLIPGLINPTSLVFTFNNNLSIGITTPIIGSNPFKCLFNTGVIAGGHGLVNGVDSQFYSINLTGLVPTHPMTERTVYIYAQQATVLESPTTIIGAPPGHPDYSPNFVPNIGYTIIQNTLNIVADFAIPAGALELARVILVLGQTSISAVDISHQIIAQVNALSVPMNGDITGQSNSNTVSYLQGSPLSVPGPVTANALLTFNGITWVAAPIGGDVAGSIGDTTVVGIQGISVSAILPVPGQALVCAEVAIPVYHHELQWEDLDGDVTGYINDNQVVGVEGIPINGSPAATGQTLVYDKVANQLNWINQVTIGAVYGPAFPPTSPIPAPPDGPPYTTIVTLGPITLPLLPAGSVGGWRLIVTYTLAVYRSGGARVTSIINDSLGNYFGAACQNFIEDTDFITGIDISPLYTEGSTITLYLQQSNGEGMQSIVSNNVTATTSLSAFVIPVLA